jgi:glycerol uptake facilitator-like aquaporin
MLRGVVESIFQPGVNNQLVVAVNVTFVLLLLILAVMTYASGFDILIFGFFVIALLLFVTVTWVIHESGRLNAEKETKKD